MRHLAVIVARRTHRMSLVDSAPIQNTAALPAPPEAALDAMALFVDVDGTMVDFAPRPDEVRVEPSVPSMLRRLQIRLGGALAPLSGRPLREIDSLLQLPPAAAAGLHGAEFRTPDGHEIAMPIDASKLDSARARAIAAAAANPGVLVEDKGIAIALHYRQAQWAKDEVGRAALDMSALAGGDFELLHGNLVIELKPRGPTKGAALAAMMHEPPFAGRTPWMIGDDLTDEDAFIRANALGGVSIIVGARRPTHANYTLDHPAAARAWVAMLASGNSARRNA